MGPTVTLRFYEELNDHLPPSRRKVSFSYPLRGPASVKHVIESVGVPHVEVDLILVNGQSVGWDHPVCEGDRIAVYPVFESVDIHPLLRLRPEPLRVPRFVLDVHLGRLARSMRMLGFDTLLLESRLPPPEQDPELARLSAAGRTLLTRDRELLKRAEVERGYWLRSTDPRKQVVEVLQRFDLVRLVDPFARCTICNGDVHAADRHAVRLRVPRSVWERGLELWECESCQRVYWEGTHHQGMGDFIGQVLREAACGGGGSVPPPAEDPQTNEPGRTRT